MKFIAFLVFAVTILSCSKSVTETSADRQSMHSFSSNLSSVAVSALGNLAEVPATKNTYAYAVYTPPGYNKYLPYPYIIFLHGMGERGYLMSLDKCIRVNGVIAEIFNGMPVPNAVIIEPQYYSTPWEASVLKATMDSVKLNYLLDDKRFYLTGLSMGGGGTANFIDSFPNAVTAAFAASASSGFKTSIAPITIANNVKGFGEYTCIPDPVVGTGNAFNNIYKIWAAEGWVQKNIQSTKPAGVATAFLDKKTKLFKWVAGQQYPDSTVFPHYIVAYDSGGHGGWSRIYSDTKFYDWLLSQR